MRLPGPLPEEEEVAVETVGDGEDEDEDDFSDMVGAVYSATAAIESFNDVKVQFAALGFIERGDRRRPGSDKSTYWRLTTRGNAHLLHLRARRRSVENRRPAASQG